MCNRYVSPTEAEMERFWLIGRKNQQRWWQPDLFPRAAGPLIRRGNELVVGQWGLIPFFAKSKTLPYATNNCRIEEVATTASYKQPWARGQRCFIPAWSFDEPCWGYARSGRPG